jgi:hypothetical protein
LTISIAQTRLEQGFRLFQCLAHRISELFKKRLSKHFQPGFHTGLQQRRAGIKSDTPYAETLVLKHVAIDLDAREEPGSRQIEITAAALELPDVDVSVYHVDHDTTDRDLQLLCGLQATQVEGARMNDWYADDQGRWVEDFRAPLDEIPALRGGEELVVFLDAEGFGPPDCYGEGALISVQTATVTYTTLGITRRTEVSLPWVFGWTDDPDAWPQVTRRDDAD